MSLSVILAQRLLAYKDASLRARESAALAGVGFERCVGLAAPGVTFARYLGQIARYLHLSAGLVPEERAVCKVSYSFMEDVGHVTDQNKQQIYVVLPQAWAVLT